MPSSPPSRQSSITAPAIAIPGAIATVLALIIGVLIAGLAAEVWQEALPSDIKRTVAVTSALILLFFVVIVIVAINAHRLSEIHRRAEAELRLREYELEQFFDLSPGPKAISRPTGQFVRANRAFCELTGYSEEELRQRTFFDITFPDDRDANAQWLAQLLRGEIRQYNIEKRYLRKDGRIIHVVLQSNLLYDSDGRPAFVIGQAIDITEQKRIEAARTSLYQIARATAETDSLDELFAAVHAIINTIMAANNFYIALYDAKNDLLSFPYFVDEIDQPAPPQKPGRGLTEYVLRTGRSLLCDAELDLKMQQLGETDLVGVSMAVWLGVPLIVGKKTIGVMAVQHYTDPRAFTDNERQVLEFVSAEVARAIERRRAADALRESEARFSHIFHNAPAAISLSDDDTGQFIDCNEGFCRFTGYSREEIIGRTRTQIGLWPSPEERQRVLAQLDLNPSLKNEIIRYRTKAGDVRSALISSEIIVINGQKCRLSMLVDITERVAAEEALRQSEERFRALAENIPGIIYQCLNDERYTMLFLNDAIADITGYPKEDFLSGRLSFVDLYHPDDIARIGLYESVNSAVAARQPFHLIYRLRHKSGEWRWVEEWGAGIYDAGGELQYLEGFLSDITERKRTDEALARTVRELAALDHMGKAVAASLELATVLSAVIEEVSPLIKAEGISILLPDADNQLVFAAASGPASGGLVGRRIPRMAGAAGNVMQTGCSILITSGEGDSQLYREVEKVSHFHTRSLLAVPLRLSGETIGVMEAVHTEPDAFSNDDQRLLEAAATWAAIAIGNARQHEQLQRRLQESEAVAAVSRALNETLDLQRLLQLIVETANNVIPNVDRAVIHLLDKDGQTLRPAAVSGAGTSLQTVIMRAGEGVAGQVIAHGQVINVGDTHSDPRYLNPEHTSPIRSLLVAPIHSGAHRVGTISVNSATPYAFSADDERLLGTLGTQTALALYNAQLFQDTRRQLDELVLLHSITLAAAEAATEDDLIQRATHLIASTFQPVSFGVMLIDETGGALVAHSSYRTGPRNFRIPLGQGITGRVAATGQPWLVDDVTREPAYISVEDDTRSELCVPLKSGNSILGVINAESERPNAFTETDLRLLATLAGQLATAIQRLRLVRDLEQALKQEKSTRAQLVQSEKLAAMGRLVASVAHELNNPLQAIQNALYLVRQEPAISLQAIEDLQVASAEANRMADLINRLRETYRPAASEEFRYESLNTIVTDVHKLIATHLRHKDIEFKFEPDPNLPYIPGIRDQLKQVLLNLSLNAVEAMPSGGRLTIRTRYEPASQQVLLAVSDTGAGIAPDVIGSVFDPFFTTKESGTGLGLTITFDIVQRHRGRIEIDSEPGRGTTFLIWLPTETQSKRS